MFGENIVLKIILVTFLVLVFIIYWENFMKAKIQDILLKILKYKGLKIL